MRSVQRPPASPFALDLSILARDPSLKTWQPTAGEEAAWICLEPTERGRPSMHVRRRHHADPASLKRRSPVPRAPKRIIFDSHERRPHRDSRTSTCRTERRLMDGAVRRRSSEERLSLAAWRRFSCSEDVSVFRLTGTMSCDRREASGRPAVGQGWSVRPQREEVGGDAWAQAHHEA